VSNPVNEVSNFFAGLDDAVHSAVDSIGSTVQNIINNPLPMIETIALTAIGVPYPIAAAAVTAANGGSIEQIAISAGAAYVGGQIGQQIGAVAEFGTTPFSEQTTMLLADSGGMASTMQMIVGSSSGAAAAAALSGKPLDQILTAGFTGGINTIVTDQLISAGYNPKDIDTRVIANAVSSASGAILQGKDVGDAITRSTIASLSSAGMKAAADKIGSTYDQIKQNSETLQGISQSFNETKAAAQEAWNNLTSYESTARSQAGEASSLLAQFQEEKGLVDSLVGQYDAAKNRVENYGSVLESEGFVPRAGRGENTLYRRYYYPDGSLNTSGSYRASLRDGLFEDAPDKTVYQDQAAAIANQLTEANTRAAAVADKFYATKAAYEDTVTNKLNPAKATYDGHVQNMVRLGEQAVQLSSETEKLGVTLGTAAGEYTVKQNELAINLATEVAKTAGQDITTQLDTKKAEDAETSRVAQAAEDKRIADAKAIEDDKAIQLAEDKKIADAKEAADLAKTQAADAEKAIQEKATQEEQTLLAEKQKQEADALAQKQKAEDDIRLAQLAEALKNPTELTGPTGLVAGPGTGIVSTPGGTDLKQIGVDEFGNPKYEMTVSAKTEDDKTNEERMVNPDGTESDAKQYRALLEQGFSDAEARERSAYPSSGDATDKTSDEIGGTGTVGTGTGADNAEYLDYLDFLKQPKFDSTGKQYDTPELPSFEKWEWQRKEPELGESEEWRQQYKEWQAQNPDLKNNNENTTKPGTDGNLPSTTTTTTPSPGGLPSTTATTTPGPSGLPSTTTSTTPSGPGGLSTVATDGTDPGGTGTGGGGGGGTGGTGTGGGGGGGTGTGGGGGTTTTTTIPKVTLPATTTSTAAPATTKTPFQPATDATSGIPNLTPGLTKAMNDYQLTGLSAIDTTPDMKSGGSTSAIDDLNSGKEYDPMSTSSVGYIKPGLTRANLQYALTGMPAPTTRKADGGEIMQEDLSMPEGHHPEFFSEGGLHNRYVRGDGDGTSDDVPAMLANGEFVIPADVVASLGNGDNDSGAKVLDEFLAVIRKHKRAADAKHLPPDSKGALGYLAEAHSKVRA
jgi:hypothetical protein